MNKKECPKCRGDFWLVRDLHDQNEEIWVCENCPYKEAKNFPRCTAARIIAACTYRAPGSGFAV